MIALVFTFVPALLTALVPRAEAGCAAPYTGAALVKDLGSVASALRNMDDSAFSSSGKALEAGLPCLDQTAPPQLYASAYRYIGAVHFLVDNDVPGARRWFRSSLELEPTYQWDAQELDLGNPLRQAWEAERPNWRRPRGSWSRGRSWRSRLAPRCCSTGGTSWRPGRRWTGRTCCSPRW